jgi:4-hydroxy-4-methyl-2-oxoglutarate aldolase
VIPKAHEDKVLAIAEEIDAVESRILDAVRSGMKLVEARRQHGYHQLQTKR